MRYWEPQPISRADARAVFASGDAERISRTLVRLAYHDPDWTWVQNQCLRFLEASDPMVVTAAATSLGHLARMHRQLDLARVLPALQSLLGDEEVAGFAEDALLDISHFMPEASPPVRNGGIRRRLG